MEWAGPRVEGGGEAARSSVGEPGEAAHEEEQVPDDQVAEDHIEEQLLFGPLGAVGGTPKVSDGGRLDQIAEVRAGPDPSRIGCRLYP